jgi:hypothetical protein
MIESIRDIAAFLDDASVEVQPSGDVTIFEGLDRKPIGRVYRQSDVSAKQLATLFALAGEILHTVRHTIRHHDQGTLGKTGDSSNIEKLRELASKVANSK